MSAINFHTKEISVKIVYYGPGLCGKTTSLQTIYRTLPEERRPPIVSLATEVDRTIFFDFLPITAYRIRDFNVRLQLYTVPGQVFYNATRKLVLNGVDGLVFVVDSQKPMKDSNLESLQNLQENLSELGLEIGDVPLVMQLNKRDLTDVFSIDEMDRLFNPRKVPVFPTVATTGEGLFDALKAISQVVVSDLVRKGLGKQLRVPKPGAEADPKESAYSTMEEAVSKAAAPAQASPRLDLWPSGHAAQAGQQIDAAMADGRWPDAITTVHELLMQEAKRWAAAKNYPGDDPLPAFLLTKGTSPTRYRGYSQALEGVRTGRSLRRAEAMSALILALEVLW